ncbi:MAG: hypothetical protein M1826_002136 [Phylliscum demangeonii]|nr:MAG: hypothetical protein M1826_002136 [Phylliscum demangeonii]
MAPFPPSSSRILARWGAAFSHARGHLSSMATSPVLATRALPPGGGGTKTVASLVRRQTTVVAIPDTYSGLNNGPAPGTVVGIVFGSVAGFLLLLWLIYSVFSMGRGNAVVEEDVIIAERRASRTSRSPRSRSRRAETAELSRSSRSRSPLPRSPVRTETRTERVIVEERRAPPPPIVDDDSEEDVVEVIEEEGPPRRTNPARARPPPSGYRPVEPDRYAGGNLPMEDVYPRRSPRRR